MRFPSFIDELPLTRAALEFAAERHGGQRRDADRAPFILHPLEVAQLLRGRDYPDQVVAAGVLHDVVEDTGVGVEELADRFGGEVAELVRAVSEPHGGGSYAQRKARLRESVASAGADAAAIFAADKVTKSRELRMSLAGASPGSYGGPDSERLDHYWASREMLEHRLGHHPFVRQLRFELETLVLRPPGDAGGAPPVSA